MSRIKQKILAFYTQRIVRADRIARTNVGFQQAQHIGILYRADNPQKHKVVNHLAEALKNKGKKVTGLCYTPLPTLQAANTFATITDRDLQLWGNITHPRARAFVNTPFDYLFQVDIVGHPVINYLLAKSQAKCRIGYYDTVRTGLFEMMVTFDRQAGSDDMDTLTKQMVHYVQRLKTS